MVQSKRRHKRILHIYYFQCIEMNAHNHHRLFQSELRLLKSTLDRITLRKFRCKNTLVKDGSLTLTQVKVPFLCSQFSPAIHSGTHSVPCTASSQCVPLKCSSQIHLKLDVPEIEALNDYFHISRLI